MQFSGGGNMAFYFNSFWINSAMNAIRQQVLEFREIPAPENSFNIGRLHQ